jgi:hypothetical protein
MPDLTLQHFRAALKLGRLFWLSMAKLVGIYKVRVYFDARHKPISWNNHCHVLG